MDQRPGNRYDIARLQEKEFCPVGIIELLIMAAMVLFNGVFAGYEIALAAVTMARLQVLARENRAGPRPPCT